MIREDLALLNVHHDVFFSERTLHADGARRSRAAISDLTLKGHIYKGKLPPPKGEKPDDWEDREQTLFRSTEVGDDMDRAAGQVGRLVHLFRRRRRLSEGQGERGFDELIFVLGADHGGYVKRHGGAGQGRHRRRVKLTVLLCQLVKLFRDGEPVRMSKRSGDFVTLREVVEEVGRDPIRFMMLYRKNDAPLDFDFAKVTEQSKDNPVFYVQYASARCHSVFRQAREQLPATDVRPRATLAAAAPAADRRGRARASSASSPNIRADRIGGAQRTSRTGMAFYLYDLASAFHAQWNRGTENADLRFVKVNDPELTYARLGLVQAVSDVIASGLALIGAEAPDRNALGSTGTSLSPFAHIALARRAQRNVAGHQAVVRVREKNG